MADRRIGEGEPQDAVAAPQMPAGLSNRAKAHWRYIVPKLLGRRTLSAADLGFLSALCVEWGEYMEAVADLEALKAGGESYKGHMIDHPRARMRGAFERYSKAAVQFGLSPASKSRVQVTAEEKKAKKSDGPPVLKIAQ